MHFYAFKLNDYIILESKVYNNTEIKKIYNLLKSYNILVDNNEKLLILKDNNENLILFKDIIRERKYIVYKYKKNFKLHSKIFNKKIECVYRIIINENIIDNINNLQIM